MTRFRARMLLLVTLLLTPVALTGAATPAWACSCPGPEGLRAIGHVSEIVFAGRAVIVIPPRPRADGAIGSADPVATTFAVDTAYRGVVGADEVVVSARSEVSCGYEFTAGGTYLVYGGRSDDGTIGTGLCNGTGGVPGDLTAADVEALGRGEYLEPRERAAVAPGEIAPVALPPTPPDGTQVTTPAGQVIAAVAVGAAAVAWLVIRRRAARK